MPISDVNGCDCIIPLHIHDTKSSLKSSNSWKITATLTPYVVVIATMSTFNTSDDNPDIRPDVSYSIRSDGSTLTDTITAVVSAMLALVFIGLIVCIIHAVRRRRQERQGNRLSQPIVQTITAGTFGTNLAAYRHVPVSGSISWENISSSQNIQSQRQNGSSASAPSREVTSDFPTPPVSLSPSDLTQQQPSTSKISLPSRIKDDKLRSSQPSTSFSSNVLPSTSFSTVLPVPSSSSNVPQISSSSNVSQISSYSIMMPSTSTAPPIT